MKTFRKYLLTLMGLFVIATLWAQEPITNVEGESFTYTRVGKCFYPKKYGDDNYIYVGNQGGAMTVVYGANKKVYFQDPVYGFIHQTYVEGTLSDDGKTITVPMGQVLYAYEDGTKVVLAVGKYEDETKEYKIDATVTEVTYSVDGENDVLTLNACGDKAPLGNFWDDGSFAGRAEWETVLTKYVEKTEVQEVTQEEEERLVTYDRSMGCAYWENSASYTDVNNTIKVAKLGDTDTILVQGMVSMLPDVWVRGVKKDNVVSFPVQLLKIEEGKKYFLGGVSSDGLNLAPFTMFYDKTLDSYAAEGRLVVNSSDITLNEKTTLGYYTGVYVGQRPELIQLPGDISSEDIQEMPYEGVFDNGQKKQPVAGTVSVAFKGQTFYMKGLIKSVPEGWLKGTYNEFGEAKIELGQYLGYDAYGNIYAVGDKADQKGFLDFTESVDDPSYIHFYYDSDKKTFELKNNLYASHKAQEINREYVLRAGLTINEGVAWVAAKQNYNNATEVVESNISNGVKATFAKSNGSNSPKYYSSGESVRMYAGNTLTIASEEKVIGKIAFVFDATSKVPMLEAQDGDFYISDDMGIWTGDGTSVTFDVINGSGNQARIKSIMVFFFDYSTATVTVPEFASIMPYEMKAKVSDPSDWFSEPEEKTIAVKVGFKGNDVYFQGLSEKVTTAWVKGKIDGDKVTIPGWSMGTFEIDNVFGDPEVCYMTFGATEFAYDAETGKFTTESYKTKNPNAFSEIDEDIEEFTEVTITRKPEVAAFPEQPVVTDFVGTGSDRYVGISVPAVDTNNSILFTKNLSYAFFVEKEKGKVESLTLAKDLYGFDKDLAEIPYDFTDDAYILRKRVALLQSDDELQSWKKIGIQSIYRGGNVENKTEINWYTLPKSNEEDPEPQIGLNDIAFSLNEGGKINPVTGKITVTFPNVVGVEDPTATNFVLAGAFNDMEFDGIEGSFASGATFYFDEFELQPNSDYTLSITSVKVDGAELAAEGGYKLNFKTRGTERRMSWMFEMDEESAAQIVTEGYANVAGSEYEDITKYMDIQKNGATTHRFYVPARDNEEIMLPDGTALPMTEDLLFKFGTKVFYVGDTEGSYKGVIAFNGKNQYMTIPNCQKGDIIIFNANRATKGSASKPTCIQAMDGAAIAYDGLLSSTGLQDSIWLGSSYANFKFEVQTDGDVRFCINNCLMKSITIEEGVENVPRKYNIVATYSENETTTTLKELVAETEGITGSTVKVNYPYWLTDAEGNAYTHGAKGSEFIEAFDLKNGEGDTTFVVNYSKTEYSGVVFLSEGEDIPGAILCTSPNTAVRSSMGKAAYFTEDVKLVTLQPGTYSVRAVLFDANKAPSYVCTLTKGEGEENEIYLSAVSSNFSEVESDEFTITKPTDITLKAGGNENQGIDVIMIYGVQDPSAPAGKYGDVNHDDEIDVTDVVLIIDDILVKNPANYDASLADVNNDNYIDVTDVVMVIDAILGKIELSRGAEPIDRSAYTAFQMDLTIPAGYVLESVSLTEIAKNSHSLAYAMMPDGRCRVVVCSMNNEALPGAWDEVISLNLRGKGDAQMTIDRAVFVTIDGERHELMMNPTSIAQISNLRSAEGRLQGKNTQTSNLYDLQGRKVGENAKGILLENGKKTIRK